MIQDFLNKKLFTKIIVLFWIISAIYSYFFFPPKDDDGVYMSIALSVFNTGIPAVFLNDEIIPAFFIFPTQPFLNGGFLKLISFFGLDPNSYNYRLLNTISFIALILITSNLINLVFKEHKFKFLLSSTFFILISVTPFSNNFYVNRPEIIGLLLIFSALYLIFSSERKKYPKKKHYIKISVMLGLASIMHPNFFILSILIYFAYFLNEFTKKSIKKILVSLFFFILPASILFIWMIVNYDFLSDQLFNRISNGLRIKNDNSFFLDIIKISLFIGDEDIFQKLYNFYFNFPLLLIISLCSILNIIILFKNKLIITLKKYEIYFFIVSLIILLFMTPYPGPICLISFLLSFNLIFIISKINFNNKIGKKLDLILSIILILNIFNPLNPIIFYKMKEYITKNNYYDKNEIKKYFNTTKVSNNILIIASPSLLPIFTDRVVKKFGKEKTKNVHWFFPIMSNPSKKFLDLYNLELDRVLENDSKKLIWGVSKKRIKKINNNDYCLPLTHDNLSIRLNSVEKIFEDRFHYFFISKEVINKNCN